MDDVTLNVVSLIERSLTNKQTENFKIVLGVLGKYYRTVLLQHEVQKQMPVVCVYNYA